MLRHRTAPRWFVVMILFGALGWGAKAGLTAWMTSVPGTPFDDTPIPPPPDYTNPDHWSALPWRADSADWVPHGSGYRDEQATAKVDVFFVHPTAAFYGDSWVAGMDNRLARLTVDYGIQPQHVTAFNGVAKIYAPRYRSVRMPIWTAADKASVEKATALAYDDVRTAFHYYLQHWNDGRPLLLVSHSQGTRHLLRLLREEFDGQPLSRQLVAAYIIGNTVALDALSPALPVCAAPDQTGCYVTWNTVVRGGSSRHWVEERGLTRIVCVNPLSWRADEAPVDQSENRGSLPMISWMGPSGLGPLLPTLVGARCGPEGILWIEAPPAADGFTRALFPGGSYHTYDINLYYESVRRNADLRVRTYLGTHAPAN